MATAAVLSIGTELTRGELVNSNASWLADALTSAGFAVTEMASVPDHSAHIGGLLARVGREYDVAVCTGGLGPTTDDITTECVARVLGVPLERDDVSLAAIRARFERFGRAMAPSNEKQADFPKGATVLPNPKGTAPGFSVQLGRSLMFFMPGVPREMTAMFEASVAPALSGFIHDAQRQIVFTRRLAPPSMPSLLVLPLLVHDRALGTLVLGSKRRSAFGDSVRPTLEVLASHVAVSLSNARMLTRLEELATLDGLTNLLNKRALIEVATQKLRSAERFKKPLCALVCDIDHFKRVNDTHGHDIGDLVIKGFADALRRVKRDTDAVGRFGGEEFVVVCEETDAQGGVLLAERIRSELEATTFHTDLGPLHVTCSVGVAPYPQAGRTWETLFKATDEALYASKRGGRNRVTVWNPRLEGYAASA